MYRERERLSIHGKKLIAWIYWFNNYAFCFFLNNFNELIIRNEIYELLINKKRETSDFLLIFL
jgi:hypothetical protein